LAQGIIVLTNDQANLSAAFLIGGFVWLALELDSGG
jgi:hypothetical protein